MNPDITSYAHLLNRGVEYTDDTITMKIDGSYVYGRESIWVNGERVSRKFTWMLRSRHTFMIDKDTYEIFFKMKNFLTSRVCISATRNGEVLFEDDLAVFTPKQAFLVLSASLLVGLGIGFLIGYFGP